jgi:galactofuranosylgalactofuranosylrhamnosyl-N-acetylglucosaminyl-diphospho-decaprenol beta-1,5/1,6-galactofuranosyltransferase
MGQDATEGMVHPPVAKRAIARAALQALRNNVRPVQTPRPPQVELPARDAQWFVLASWTAPRWPRPTVAGVTVRRRDPATFWRLARESVRLNLEIARRFPRAKQQYRDSYADLTSAQNWESVFEA